MPRRRPARPYHHGDLPRALREGALALISELGAEAFTMRELARRLGVSHAAPYRHYADKRALITALAAEGSTLLADRIEAALSAAGDDLRARFLNASHAYVRFALDEPAYFKVMYLSGEIDKDDPALVAGNKRSLGLLYRFIADAQAAGYFRAGDPNSMAVPIWAMHQGLAVLAAVGVFSELGFPDMRAVSDMAHGALLDGLLSRGEEDAAPTGKQEAPAKSRGTAKRGAAR